MKLKGNLFFGSGGPFRRARTDSRSFEGSRLFGPASGRGRRGVFSVDGRRIRSGRRRSAESGRSGGDRPGPTGRRRPRECSCSCVLAAAGGRSCSSGQVRGLGLVGLSGVQSRSLESVALDALLQFLSLLLRLSGQNVLQLYLNAADLCLLEGLPLLLHLHDLQLPTVFPLPHQQFTTSSFRNYALPIKVSQILALKLLNLQSQSQYIHIIYFTVPVFIQVLNQPLSAVATQWGSQILKRKNMSFVKFTC